MKTGDRVVCVETYVKNGVGVYKDKIYYILGMWECNCGIIRFDVGLRAPWGFVGTDCKECGDVRHDGMAWPKRKYFAIIEYNSATEELANKGIIEEKSDIPIKEPKKEEA